MSTNIDPVTVSDSTLRRKRPRGSRRGLHLTKGVKIGLGDEGAEATQDAEVPIHDRRRSCQLDGNA
jgi:hypothetical protein